MCWQLYLQIMSMPFHRLNQFSYLIKKIILSQTTKNLIMHLLCVLLCVWPEGYFLPKKIMHLSVNGVLIIKKLPTFFSSLFFSAFLGHFWKCYSPPTSFHLFEVSNQFHLTGLLEFPGWDNSKNYSSCL